MARHRDTAEHSTEERHDHDGRTLAVPRSRGVVTGVLLIALGAWGALLPLIGPRYHFGFGPDSKTFDFTAARFWLQILPGVAAVLAGLFLLVGANRVTGTVFAYLGCAAGAWFVVGPILADLRTSGYVGNPLGSSDRQHLGAIAAFYGLGAVILFLSALAAGRMSVVGIRDVRAKEARHDTGYETAEASPTYPATREVPVTTTNVRPAEAPEVLTLPAEHEVRGPAQPGAVIDPSSR